MVYPKIRTEKFEKRSSLFEGSFFRVREKIRTKGIESQAFSRSISNRSSIVTAKSTRRIGWLERIEYFGRLVSANLSPGRPKCSAVPMWRRVNANLAKILVLSFVVLSGHWLGAQDGTLVKNTSGIDQIIEVGVGTGTPVTPFRVQAAQWFKTDNGVDTYVVSSIRLNIDLNSSDDMNNVSVQMWRGGSSRFPTVNSSDLRFTFENPDTFDGVFATFTVPSDTSDADKTIGGPAVGGVTNRGNWIRVWLDPMGEHNGYVDLAATSSDGTDTGSLPDWTIGDEARIKTGGSSWQKHVLGRGIKFELIGSRVGDTGDPRVIFTNTPRVIGEGESSTVTATVDPISTTAFSVNVAVTPDAPATTADFTVSANTTLEFAASASASTGTVTVTAVDDTDPEGDQTLTVSGTTTTAGIVVTDEKKIRISQNDLKPPAPASFVAAPTHDHVILSWDHSANPNHPITGHDYKIKKSTDADFPPSWSVIGNSGRGEEHFEETEVRSLDSNVTYEIQLSSKNGQRRSEIVTASATTFTPFAAKFINPPDPFVPGPHTSVRVEFEFDDDLRDLEMLSAGTGGNIELFFSSVVSKGRVVMGMNRQWYLELRPDYIEGNAEGIAEEITVVLRNTPPRTRCSATEITRLCSSDGRPLVEAVSLTIHAATLPRAPTALTATAGAGQVALAWTAAGSNVDLTKYQYQYKVGSGAYGAWTDIPDSATGGANATSYTITGLSTAVHTFQVKAFNSRGEGPESSEASASPTQATNSAPVFNSNLNTSLNVAENTATGSNIGNPFTATDANSSDTLTYSLEGTDAASFQVVSTSGQLQTRAALNHEGTTSYAVTVKVSDGTASATHAVTVNVTDVNEPPAAPAVPTETSKTATTVVIGWAAPSTTDRPTITGYRLQFRAGTTGSWTERAHAGTGTTATISGLAPSTLHQFQVQASNDEGTSGWSPVLQVTTTAVVSNPPVFDSGLAVAVEVAENTAADTDIGSPFTATDVDNDTLTWTLEGSDAASFKVVSTSGQLQTKAALNHEGKASYAVTVKVSDGTDSDTHTVTVNVTDVSEPPGTPAAPTVAASNITAITVNWVAPTNTGPSPMQYDLQYKVASAAGFTDGPQDQSGLSATIDSLVANTMYDIQVRATNAEGDGDWSTSLSATTSAQVPSATSNLAATPGNGKVTLSWNASADKHDVNAHEYHYKTDGDYNSWTEIPDSGEGEANATGFTVSGLTNDVQHTFEVRARNVNGPGVESAEVTATPTNTAPAFNNGLSATLSVDENTVADTNLGNPFTATDADNDTLTYTLEGDDATSFQVVSTSGQLQTKAALNYENTTSYSVSVKVSDGIASATHAVTINVTDVAEPPGRPAAPTHASNTGTSITVNWVAPTNTGPSPMQYDLRYKWVEQITFMNGPQDQTGLSATIDNLPDHHTIDIQVRATNDEGESDWSPSVTISNDAESRPAVPSNLAATPGDTQVVLSWNAPAAVHSVTSHDHRYKTDGAYGSWTAISDSGDGGANEVGFTVTGLTNDQMHTFQVRAVNAIGIGGESEEVTATPTASVNNVPAFTSGLPATLDVAENTAADTDIGSPFTATDGDNDTLTYTLEGTGAASFDIVSSSGQLKTKSALDYEATTSYSVSIRVSDGVASANHALTINVTNQEVPTAPTNFALTSRTYNSMSFSWTAPTTTATRPVLYYDITVDNESGDNFRTENIPSSATTGTVTGLSPGSEYVAKVAAKNGEGVGASSNSSGSVSTYTKPFVVIAAKSGGETAVEGTDSAAVFELRRENTAESDPVSPFIANVAVTQEGDYIEGTPPTTVEFGENVNLKELSVSIENDEVAEDDGSITATLSASSSSNVSNTRGTATITVEDDDTANAVPTFSSGLPATVTVAENTAADRNIGNRFTAMDGDNDTLTWTLEGTDAASFKVVSDTGQLQTSAALNHEGKASYAVTVKVSDGTASATHAVTVNVTDVDEAPLAPAVPTVGSSTSTSITVNWTAPSNAGRPAILHYDVQYMAQGATDFTAGPEDEEGTSATIDSLTTETTYLIQVRAVNDEGEGTWSPSLTAVTPATPTVPVVSIAANTTTVTEGTDAAAVFTLTRDGDATAVLTVNIGVVVDGKFFLVTQPTSAMFIADATTTTVSITVDNDDVYDRDGSATVTVETGMGYTVASGTGGMATISVLNDDAPSGGNLPPLGSSETELWEGVVLLYGFDADTILANSNNLGRIEPSSFMHAGNSYTVSLILNTLTAGKLNFVLSPRPSSATFADWKLYIGSAITKDFSTATGETVLGFNSFTWVDSSAFGSGNTTFVDGNVIVMRITQAPAVPAVPSNLAATPGDTQVVLSWDAPADADDVTSHDYRYKTDGAYGSWTAISDSGDGGANEAGFTVTGLTNDQMHTFQVRAVNANGAGGESAEVTATPMGSVNNVPAFTSDPPATLDVAENTAADTNIGSPFTATDGDNDTLTWTLEGTDAASFKVVSDTGQLQTSAALNFESKASYAVTVKVSDGTASATHAVTVNVTDVGGEVPAAIEKPEISAKTSSGFTVTWTAPANPGPAISAYGIQYRAGTSGPHTQRMHDDVDTTAYTVTELDAGVLYEVQLRAINDDGEAPWSDIETAETEDNASPVFTEATPTREVEENTVAEAAIGTAVTATDADDTELTYTLGGTDADSFAIVATTGQLQTSAALNYEVKTSYAVTVTATDDQDASAAVDVTVNVTDVDEAPLAPAVPTVGSSTSTSITVNWTAPSNAGRPAILHYDVQYMAQGATDFTAGPEDEEGMSATIDSLTTETTYLIQVRAVNDEGEGTWSPSLTAVTPATPTVPVVSIAANTATVTEGTDAAAVFTLTRDGDATAALTVNIGVAVDGEFFLQTQPMSAMFMADATTTTVSITVQEDEVYSLDGTATVTVESGTGYTVASGTAGMATVSVLNDDDPSGGHLPSVQAGETELWEGVISLHGTSTDIILANDFFGDIVPDSFMHAGNSYSLELILNTISTGKLNLGLVPLPSSTTIGDWKLYIGSAITKDFSASTTELVSTINTFVWTDSSAFGSGNTPFTDGEVIVMRITQAPAVPAVPSNLVATPGDTQVVLSWDAPADADDVTSHDYRYKTDGAYGSWTAISDSGDGGANEAGFTVTGLTNDQMHTFQVRAVNTNGAGGESAEVTATPTASVNNVPVFTNGLAVAVDVAENTAADTNIGSPFTATDGDNDTLTWTLEGTDAASFKVVSDTGQLQTSAALNHEGKASYAVTVKVSDGTASATHAVTVNVTDVDEPPPAPAAPTETSKTSTTVVIGWVAPSTTDRPAVTGYGLQFRATGSFTAQTHAGTGTTATVDNLTPSTLYEIQVRASNDEGTGDWSPALEVTTAAAVNNAPEFTSGLATTVDVAENTAADTDIGSPFTATDDDDDTLTWTLEGTDAASFKVVGDTGQLQTSAALNHEGKASYAVTVKVSDGTDSATHAVTVNVTDVDEPPPAPTAPTETSTTSTTVVIGWTAPAITGRPAITGYGLQFRAGTSGPFTAETHAGTGTTATLDNLTPSTLYEIQVQASNDEGTGPWSPSLTVTTAAPANNAPVFTEATPVREVAENTSNGEDIGAVIAATDADASDTLSWTLGGTDASSFSIVSTSGQLQTSAGLDFENRSSYAVTVTVSDTKATASVDVTINVTDVDEPPVAPAAPTETSKTSTTVVIGWVAPSTADRPAITGYGLQYRAGTTGPFTALTHDGTGTTATVDSLTPSTLYEIQVQASNDEGTGPWSPSLTVTTVAPANNAPVFTEATPVREVAENTGGGEDIGAVIAATDADAGDTLSWTLGGTDASSFSIVGTSGQLQTSAGLDFENRSSYAVTVTVSDTKATASVDVTINVADADEPPPAPSAPEIVASTSSSLEVSWVAPSSSGIPALSGFDLQYQATGESGFTAGPQDVEPTATGATLAGLAPNTGYAIQVRAQNAEGEGEWSASLSTSTASNRVPEFDVAAPTFTVAENTAADTAIGTAVTATDPDGDAVTYSLTGTHAANFSIDASGQIATSAALNFEEQTSHALAVQAEDIHGGTASLAVAINVTDVGGEVPAAIEKPQISAITSSGFTVTWDAPANPGPALSAYGIQYRAVSTGPFTQGTHDDVDTTTNTVSGLDAGVVHEVQLRASNADGDGPWSDIETAETEDNASPVFTEATPTREVEENTVAEAAIGTAVTATDANDTELTYTLGGADADSFAIVAATGQLQTSAALNYEVETSYAVTVTATDDQGASAAVDVAIAVTDLEEPPAAPAAPTFPNSLTSSLEVAWTAPVNTGPAITDYNVQYRAGTSGPFTAATHDGTDTGTTLTGLAADTDHEVQVQATNAEGTGPWSASGTGTTVDNAAPTFDTAGALTFTVSENTGSGASVGDAVAATDSDGGTLTYTLEGADADSFDIVADSGQIATAAVLNYEEQTSHAVVVRVEDGQGGSATKAVTINVTDIAEPPAPPAAPTISGQTLTSFTATWEAPFNTGPAITDYDVRYRPGSSGDYTAVAHDGTGLSTTLAGLTANTSYEVQVQAINAEGSSAWSAAATGTTTTNTAPAFDAGGPVALTVAENTAANEAVGSPLGASDADGDTLTFSIVGVDAAAFAMDAGTGQLSTSATLDFEDDPSYAFTATVADGNGGSASLALTITVTDADEPPLAPNVPQLVTATTESLAIEWIAPANAGRPVIDDYDVRYRVTDTIPFSDGPQNVETTSATIDELDVDTSYDVQVRAVNDEGDGDWSQSLIARTAAALNIPPEFPADTAARSVAENTAAQQAIGAPVTASDEDDDTLTYTLEGTNAGLFDIDASSGQLLTRAGLDHESTETIVVTVVADDGNGGTDTVAVTVSVTDVDEPPLAPVQPTLTAATSTSLTISWVAPSNAGRPDIDNYDVQFRLTSVIDYSDGPQQVDGQSATIMDLTESSEYEIQVRARNDEGEGAWSSTLTAATPAASNNPPVFDTGADQARSIVENTTSGEPVGGPVTATDADGDTLTFSLEGADRGSFTIGSDTGQLRTLAGLDFESKASYALTARVEDGNGGFDTIALTITVTDADEPPLVPTALRLVSATASSLTLAWTAPLNSGRPVISGYDLQYRQVGEEDYLDGPQDVETITGTIIGLGTETAYEVRVNAGNDEGDGEFSAPLTASTTAVGNNVPVFDDGVGDDRSVAENTASGVAIGAPVSATDADMDTLTYSLEGTDADAFTIDASSGQLQTEGALNHEGRSAYSVTVRASDGRGGAVTIAVAITVTDVDEPPDAPSAPRLTSATSGSLTISWTAPNTVGRPAISTYDVQYRESGGTAYTAGPSNVPGTTTTATLTDLSADTLHEVEVRATNAEGTGPWSAALSARTLAEAAPVTVTIAAVSATVTEGMNAVFTLTRGGDAASALDVGVAVTETGSTLSGTPPTSVTFAAAALTATLTVATVDDTTDEAASTITATIQDGDGYDPGSTSSATVTVADNDETLSNNAQLQTLSLTGVDFGTFQGSTLTYTASVEFGTMQTTVTAVPAEAAASVEIEPADANADDDGHQVSLGVGETGIAVIVTAADNATTQTYRVAVTRLQEREEEMQARQSYATQLAQAISSHTLEAMNVRFVELPTAAPASTSSVFENSPLHGFLPSTGAVGPDGGTADGPSNLNVASAMSSAMNGDLTFDHDRHPGSNSKFHLGNLRNWLGNQRFIQPLNAGSKGGGSGGVWSLWGLASRTDFEYRGADFDLSGDVFTGTLGMDYEVDAWLVGIAVSRSSGDGDVSRIATPIEASSELTIIQPYVRLSITPALQAWAMYGAGEGFITSPGSDVENDLQLNLLAVGSHGQLLDGSNGGWGAAINADYLVTRSMLHDTLSAIENEAEGSRVRLALEGSMNWLMASGGVLTYFVELGGRFESGEETDQQGLEVRSGFKYRHASGRVSVGMDVRSFEAEDDAQGTYEELGVSASIRLSTKHGGKGASLTVLSGWGAEDSRIDGMWSDRHGTAIAYGRHFNVEPRLDTEFGYGFDALREHGLLTPYLGYRYMGRRGDIYRIGAKLLMRDALDLRLENQLHRDERMDRVNLRTSVVVIIRW